jgi:hypothetical protein
MTADSRFAHGTWQRRNGQSAGIRNQIITAAPHHRGLARRQGTVMQRAAGSGLRHAGRGVSSPGGPPALYLRAAPSVQADGEYRAVSRSAERSRHRSRVPRTGTGRDCLPAISGR